MQALFVALPQLHLLWSFACRGAFVPLPAVSRSATDNGLIRVQLQIETRGRSLLLTSLHHSTPCRQHAGFIFLKRVGKGILRSSIPSPKEGHRGRYPCDESHFQKGHGEEGGSGSHHGAEKCLGSSSDIQVTVSRGNVNDVDAETHEQ